MSIKAWLVSHGFMKWDRKVTSLVRRRIHPKITLRLINAVGGGSEPASSPGSARRWLPLTCPGCGAFSQVRTKEAPGFFNIARKHVHGFLSKDVGDSVSSHVSDVQLFRESLSHAGHDLATKLGLEESPSEGEPASLGPPRCDRCHSLFHHHKAGSIVNPSLESIKEMILQSPHTSNHIYHVIDAADFPLSLVPGLHQTLSLSPQRSRNRRSRSTHYSQGRKAEVSFIITRSDLLAPTKQKLDSMMPYLRRVLREALGSNRGRYRLGNLRCVSADRGWWTKSLKEEILNRGGGGWMVGKVNVGKSRLYESVFPKGQFSNGQVKPIMRVKDTSASSPLGLLPPSPPEVSYPPLPTVSHIPGTTAAPIRNLYGNQKGELIDLPGLPRCGFQDYVEEKHSSSLIMRHKLKERQYNLKPGHSATISNLIQFTPGLEGHTFQVYPFTPLPCHVVETEKAKAFLAQTVPAFRGVARQGLGKVIASAGVFVLDWDVTRERCGPLTNRGAVGLDPRTLPFIIRACDILLEGLGWVEVSVQLRRKDLETSANGLIPSVEVFSPSGHGIGTRQPLISYKQQ